jgi:O-antigen/teichoic acid export membrane protein
MVITNIISLIVLHMGIYGYLLSYIVSNVIGIILLIVLGRLYKYFRFGKIDWKLMKEMFSYSIPMIPNSISWWISNSSDKYILTYFCGATATGIYSVSYKIPTILSVCYGIFMSAWRLSAVDDFGSVETEKFYSEVFTKLTKVLIIMGAGIILFNKVLAKFLYANDFYNAKEFVPVLVIAFLLHGLSEFYGSIYTSAKCTKLLMYSSFIGALSNIVLNFLLIPEFQGMGAALATLISYGLILMIRAIHSRKFLKIEISVVIITISSVLLCLIATVQTMDFIGAFLISSVLFCILVVLNREIVVEICKMIRKCLKRVEEKILN